MVNNYFKGRLLGDFIFFPFFTFDLELDIDLLKFNNILNIMFSKKSDFFAKLIPINNKINGNLKININEIASTSNVINSGIAELEFVNGILKAKNIQLNMNKIGAINLNGAFLKKKNKKLFVFDGLINISNSDVFYSRFLIPKQSRKPLKPINLTGKIDLQTSEIKLDKMYFNNKTEDELRDDKLETLNENINEIFLQNSLENILRYSNLRKIIQSFFN